MAARSIFSLMRRIAAAGRGLSASDSHALMLGQRVASIHVYLEGRLGRKAGRTKEI